jgi:hypothetical protein
MACEATGVASGDGALDVGVEGVLAVACRVVGRGMVGGM